MDSIQAVIASLGIIGIVLLMAIFVCHLFGPKTTAWVCANHEEKIGLSQNKIYNVNGYLINSDSEILLSSTGSFRRFDSIDRDYKENGQTSVTSPTWNIPIPNIPPQPLRPAPAPAASTKSRKTSLDKPITQQSCDTFVPLNAIIPRPVAKRQLSSPAGALVSLNLPDAPTMITNERRSCTNPFFNACRSIPETANLLENDINMIQTDKSFELTSETIFSNNNEKCFYQCSSVISKPFQVDKNPDSIFKFDSKCLSNVFENDFITPPSTNTIFRNRSLSETEMSDSKSNLILSKNDSTNPFKRNLHKPSSETYLEQYSMNQRMLQFENSLSRQGSNASLTRSQFAIDKENSDIDFKRAMSCESVNSESSVVQEDLEKQTPANTGMLCIGLQYDRSTFTDQVEGELVVTVMEAKELIRPANEENIDTFVRIYLVPDATEALQTKLFKNSLCPSYNETFCFELQNKKRTGRSLWFHLYHSGNVHTLLGEGEFKIGDMTRPVTTWVPLSDSRHNNSAWGELMFSISYLPTAERLTVVVVKARNLKLSDGELQTLQNVFVKVYLLKSNKKVYKKRTSIKRAERSPIYNESVTFSVPPYILNSCQVRLTVVNGADTICDNNKAKIIPIGHVIVGGNTNGKELKHWNQMLTSLRRPVAMWHALRQSTKRRI